MEIYVGRRRNVGKGFWMSFENHPRLQETKKSIYERCLPCLEKLHEQLKQAPSSLVLEEPLSCWKVVVVFNEFDDCLDLLQAYQDDKFSFQHTVRGRIGTNNYNSHHVTVIFNVNDEDERDELFFGLEKLAGQIASDFKIFYERGCQDLYCTLCGNWSTWDKVTPIKNPSMIEGLEKKVGKLLRGEY